MDHVTYDKAGWHLDGEFPEDLQEEQAYVHTGIYLGWLVDNDLYDPASRFGIEGAAMIEAFKRREITGVDLYKFWGGYLFSAMLNEEGNAFSQSYYDELYFADYEELLAGGLSSSYHVKNTWDNYQKLKQRLDERYREWRQRNKEEQ